MGYDWKRHDREFDQRLVRSALVMGLTFVALAVVGTTVMLVTQSVERLIVPTVCSAVFGAMALLWWRFRKRREA